MRKETKRTLFIETEFETWGFESADRRSRGDYEKIHSTGWSGEFICRDGAIETFYKLVDIHANAGRSIAVRGIDAREWKEREGEGKDPFEICFHARLYDENEDLILSSSISVYRNKDRTLSGMNLRD